MAERPIGYVVDNATPTRVSFVSSRPPRLGDYILLRVRGENDEVVEVLGFVEHVGSRSITLSTVKSVKEPKFLEAAKGIIGGDDDTFYEARARIIGDVNTLENPRIPPHPGTPVYRAPSSLLRRIFGGNGRPAIRIGVLAARPEVPVYIDVNKLVTRHAAILAVTGAGKSNTVAVIADRMVRSYSATVIILDFHGEYVGSSIGGGVHVINPKLNPRNLTISELKTLLGIESRYYHQERVLRKAYNRVVQAQSQHNSVQSNGGFIEQLKKAVEQLRGKEEPKAVAAVLNKIEGLVEKYSDILDDTAGDIIARIVPGKVNVLDLSRVDEEAADVIASHVLRRILNERKRFKIEGEGLPYPVFIVVEEAHILAPKDEDTLSKYWLARIAREGRKFGVGLCLVSQRPKNIDPDILSQTNNKFILRIVEPSDQKYVQMATETLSDDLLEQLPGLNTGEAIVLGPILPIPALVKIDLFEGRKGGTDPDVVSEWLEYQKFNQNEHNPTLDIIDELG